MVIAWVLAQGEDIVTIPGTKRIKNLKENIAAEQVTPGKEELETIDAVMPAGSVSGNRYPEVFIKAPGK